MRTSNLPGRLHATPMTLFCVALVAASPAVAQKKGGTLRLYHNDNPPSTSLHEEATIASVTPFAAIFNNLVVFDPAKSTKASIPSFRIWPKAGPGIPATPN